MLKFIQLKKYDYSEDLIKIWNEAFNYIYPVSLEQFNQNTFCNGDILSNGSLVAILDNTPVGFIATKINEKNDSAYINSLVVLPKYQNQGIGSKLLEFAEFEVKKLNKKEIHVGRDTYDYFPGVPFDFIDSKKWFEKKGYINTRHTHDLICSNLSLIETNSTNPYQMRKASIEDKEELLAFFRRCFPGRWEDECINYFNNGGLGHDYYIVIDKDKIIGFCRMNDEKTCEISNNLNWSLRFDNLGGIGPLGIDKQYRKQKLGYQLTTRAINDLIDRGVSEIIIDWTSLIGFYRKFGFEVWKTYYYMSKMIET